MEVGQDNANIAWLSDIVRSTGESLQVKYGSLYFYYLERATSLIETTIRREAVSSPIIAAVTLGVRGDFAALIGDDHDAFNFLVQAAIRILLDGSRSCRLLS